MADISGKLVECFSTLLSPRPDAIKQAEVVLKELATQPGYSIAVLKVVSQESVDVAVRLAAAVNFKNAMKHSWAPDEDSQVQVVRISPAEQDEIKTYIVTLMLQAQPSIRAQLSEALTIISQTDFPDKWKTLLPELREKLNTENIDVIVGALETINSVFKHFHTADIDSINASLDYCQKIISEPILRIVQMLETAVAAQAQDKAALTKLLSAVRLCNEIFHSLNFHGLSETMEPQMDAWMKVFHHWLEYSNPLLKEADTDRESADDAVKATVCDNINLYMQYNEEEIEPYLQTLVSDVWKLLMSCTLHVGQDRVAMTGMAFLTAVCHTVHHSLFSGQDTLKEICEGIIVPNMQLREEDEETFELNYVEYVRRDHEGSDNDTRRRSASDLVRCLTDKFPEQTTTMFLHYIQGLLQEYSVGGVSNWKSKDCAMYLTMALAVKGKTAAHGATTVNPLVDVPLFCQQHVAPELVNDVNSLPVLKADALRFITLFRSKLGKDSLKQVFPTLVALLAADSNVVHSYAAITIERLLALRVGGQPLFVPADVAGHLETLLSNLFAAFDKPESGTNEYLMTCVMRVISFVGPQIIPIAGICLDRLTAMLLRVCGNPVFAGFNHYLFEAVAALVKCTSSDKAQLDALEARIFPCFDIVLQQDVQEFHPYVFQIFALLLASHAVPVPDIYVNVMLAPFLQHFFWERKGNIPALTMLVQVYLEKAAPAIIQKGLLESVLGIFQKLLSMTRHLHEAYTLLNAVAAHVPLDALSPYLANIFMLLFGKLTGPTKSARNSVFFITFVARAACQYGAAAAMAAMDSVQPGSSLAIVTQVMPNNLSHVVDRDACKLLAVGLARILCESPALLAAANNAWTSVLAALITFIESEKKGQADDDEGNVESLEEVLSDNTEFSKLACAKLPRQPVLPEVTDVRQNLARSLAQASAASPGKLMPLVVSMPAECQAKLNEYLLSCGMVLA